MWYLRKESNKTDDPRLDNVEKMKLFHKNPHFNTAESYRITWEFIPDGEVKNNIAYQMQYLEFQLNLYNSYRIYLTHESLHLKNTIATICGIVEAALYVLIKEHHKNAGLEFKQKVDMLELILTAEDIGLIDEETKNDFYKLREHRELVHFGTLDYKEYSHYRYIDVNHHLNSLFSFVRRMRIKFNCSYHDTPTPPNTVIVGPHDPLRDYYFNV